jgi:diguanylate cyclase (GGDEF)-like protein
LLASDAGAVLIYHQEREDFTPGASIGLDPAATTYAADLSATYLIGRVAGMSGPLQVTDTSLTTTLSLPRLSGDRRTMAAICAPIIHGGEMLGAIEIYSATPRAFSEDDTSLLSAFAHQAAIALSSVQSQETRRRALMGAVEALASANEARDGYTGEHCKRLAQLAMLIARARGFSEEEVERIGLGAALHDIGKIAVPDAILRKPGPLTDEERTIIQLHPATGQEIVARVPELQDVALMVGAHQERWDGAGYPNHLAGNDIPLGARIIAVVDTYAALVEDRPYRAGASHEDALAEIVASSGTQFDPEIVQTFVEVQESVRRLMADTESMADGSWLTPPHQATPAGIATTTSNYLPEHRWQLHRASELSALNDIIRTIAITSDLPRMYDLLYRKLSDLLDVDAMLILLAGEPNTGSRQLVDLRRSPHFPPIGFPVEEEIIASVARVKRPLRIDDYQVFARERQIALPPDETFGQLPRSAIVVPIVIEDAFLGVLTVQALHPNAYDNRHIDLIEDIALHVGIAIRNQQQRTNAIPAATQEFVTQPWLEELNTLPGLDDATRLLAERVREAVPYDGCIIFLLQQGDLGAAAVEGYYSLPERRAYQTYRMPRGVGIFWTAIEQGRSIVVTNLAEHSQGAVLLRPPVPGESALVTPLTANGATIGVIFLTRLAGAFDSADERRLNQLAQSAAGVLDRFQQRALELHRVRDLGNLQVALDKIAAGTTRDAVLDTLVRALAEQFSYRYASAYIRSGDALILQTQIGYDTVLDRIPLGKGILARAVREQTSQLIDDVGADTGYLEAVPGIHSEIAVPIVVDGQTIGGLNVESGRERQLGNWDLSLIELLVRQAGSTLSRIRAMGTGGSGLLAGEPALIDQTTSLATQAAMMAGLEADVSQFHEDGEPLALLFIDLDHFKLANDAYGHRFGDELMSWMGEFLPQELPFQTRIARYAGDAFVAVLPGMTIAEAGAIAERLRATMAERTFETSLGHTVLLSISVGVAGLEPTGPQFATADELLHAADRAMYAAKLEGRNRVICWSTDLVARPVLAS